MKQTTKLLDMVALIEACPEQGLVRGQVGTIVEVSEPDVFEVEFGDTQERMYALETLRSDQLMLLHHQPISRDMLTTG
jgi:hypothetical protein